jgi:hypothetical protein
MLMNNGQNTRSYSPVVADAPKESMTKEEAKEKLKELVKEQIANEVIVALTLSDLAGSYWKMGLEGHKHKLYHKASREFKENFDWRKYYHDVFDELPHVHVEYESKDSVKSMDDVYNKMYELHLKSKENIHNILRLSSEYGIYTDMKLLHDAFTKCEEHEEKLEAKMRRSQMFGYDVAYILNKDDRLHCEYKEHKARKKYEHEHRTLKPYYHEK